MVRFYIQVYLQHSDTSDIFVRSTAKTLASVSLNPTEGSGSQLVWLWGPTITPLMAPKNVSLKLIS